MSMPARLWTRLARVATVTLLSTTGALALVPSTASAAEGRSAIIDDPACATTVTPLNDDNEFGPVELAHPIRIGNQTTSAVHVSNNGYFSSSQASRFAYLSAFEYDLDTRSTGTPMTYGSTTYDGRPALCANWFDIGFYGYGTTYRSSAQAFLVDRSDVAAGDFDLVVNYGRVDTPRGVGVGYAYSDFETGASTNVRLPGSWDPVAQNDSNLETGLVHTSRESAVLGRHVLRFRDGVLVSAPETTITSEVAERSTTASPSFTYAASGQDHARFECRLTAEGDEPAGFATCADDGTSYDDLADGTYTFEVRAVDAVGGTDESPASATFTVDTTGPVTELEDTPGTLTNDNAPVFTWSSADEDVESFTCHLDRVPSGEPSPWFDCESGDDLGNLGDGDWTFQVAGVDDLGNVGEPVTHDFTIDTEAAAVALTAKPAALGNDATPSFTYAADPTTDLDHFVCVVVPVGAQYASPETCAADGFTSEQLADGDYRFTVVAVDTAGNESDPAWWEFTVDTAAPDTTVTDGPAATIGTGSARFGFASSETPATFECRISGAQPGAWQACDAAGRAYDGLTDGTWTFEVRATDAAGNTDATPASRKVTVNLGRPTITAAISSPTPVSAHGWYRDTVTITYTCDGNGSALVGACPAPREVPRAQQGKVVFRAAVATADGDSASVSTTLWIDKGKPQLRIKGFSGQRSYASVPKPRCQASDPRSGIDDCTVSVRKVERKDGRTFVVVKATATDKAGNVRVVRKQAPFRAA